MEYLVYLNVERKHKQNMERKYSLLFAGILILSFGCYLLVNSFARKSDLVKINGTIRSAKTYIEKVEGRDGHKSQKSELIFYLNEHNKKFYFMRNIGSKYYDEEYEKIKRSLLNVDSVTVWVRSRNINDYEPKVFQISNNENVILSIEDVRTEASIPVISFVLLGFSAIIFSLSLIFPEKRNKVLNWINEKPAPN